MIIYGWNSKELKKTAELGEPCVKCAKHTTVVGATAHYFHVFWIPIIPYRKPVEVICENCNYIARVSELSEQAKAKVKRVKRSIQAPIYMYSGLLLIIIAIIYFSSPSA